MAFYHLSFMKLLLLNFIGVIIILTLYLFYNDINNFSMHIKMGNISEVEVYQDPYPEYPFPNNPGIKKIDVGRGEDLWILTDNCDFYHWNTIIKEFIHKESNVVDFSIGSDGTVVYINNTGQIYISNLGSWYKIDDGSYSHNTISICNYGTIYTTDDFADFIKGVYGGRIIYNWKYVDEVKYYYQVSCAFHDHSLWFRSSDKHAYLYINNYYSIPRSEFPFKKIKALSKQHAIGIDYNDNLWEYTSGTWVLLRNNVKTASINYNGEIFFVNYNDVIYRIRRNYPKK